MPRESTLTDVVDAVSSLYDELVNIREAIEKLTARFDEQNTDSDEDGDPWPSDNPQRAPETSRDW